MKQNINESKKEQPAIPALNNNLFQTYRETKQNSGNETNSRQQKQHGEKDNIKVQQYYNNTNCVLTSLKT